MRIQELRTKSVSELRAIAKKAGITAKKGWKKEDFIKALSAKKKTKAAQPRAKSASKSKRKASKRAPAGAARKKAGAKAKKAPVKKRTAASSRKLPAEPMEQLTVAELRVLAKDMDIPLAGARKKADIIRVISSAKPPRGKKAAPKTAGRKAKGTEKRRKPGPQKRSRAAEPAPEATPQVIEYPQDKIVSMPVAPRRLYVYWDVAEGTVSKYRGSLNLKILDLKTNAFFYMPISERIGEHSITVSAEGEYTIEVGVIDNNGEFVNLVEFLPIEAPGAGEAPEPGGEPSGEAGLPEEFFPLPPAAASSY